MGFVDFVKSRISGETPAQEAIGTIVVGPEWVEDSETPKSVLCFRIDTLHDIEFRQTVSPLAPQRKHGDRVKVHYRDGKDGQAIVDWCEGS